MKYKLFISDYDGTLGIAPANTIDEETLFAINKFIEKGGIFVVCSGRETSSIGKILKKCSIKGLVASLQGAVISDIESGENIFNGGLTSQMAIEAINAVKSTGLTPLFYYKGQMFYQEYNEYVRVYDNAVKVHGEVVDVVEKLKTIDDVVSKVCWVGDDKLVNETADKMNEIYKNNGLKFNSGATCLLEAINPECGKGQAVRFIANHFNIPLEQVIAVGDSTNDIELINGPWHGVAVGDGKDALKKVAKEITLPFEQKPVKHLLEKYCLND